MNKPNILFLCTGNSCRSQMAEGWARHFHKDRFNAFSAGTQAQGLNPLAVKTMAECGVDISQHTSNNLPDFADIDFYIVFTVCGNAHENCPVFSGKTKVIHHGFDDPPALAESANNEAEKMAPYLRVCREIAVWIQALDISQPA